MWTKDKVAAELQKHPDFEHLFEEGSGKYQCTYEVGGVPVRIFYSVGGMVEIWLLSEPTLFGNIQEVQAFVSNAYKICMEKLNEKGKGHE